MTLKTNRGKMTLVYHRDGTGVLNEASRTAFTFGYCHCFAAEMHKETGWPMVALGGEGLVYPAHFILYSPQIDEYVDIGGAGALKRWDRLAKKFIGEAELSDIPPVPWYRPLDLKLAKPFVTSVLEEINTLPKAHSTDKAAYYLNGTIDIQP